MSCFENEADFIGDAAMIDSMRRTYDELIALARDIRNQLVASKILCKPPLSGKIRKTMEVKLWHEKRKANSGR